MKRRLAVLAAALCVSCANHPSRPVAIGINPWPGYEMLYLAAEKGIFARHGLLIQLEEYSSLGDVRRAFEHGQIDGMACTLVEVLQAREHSGRDPKIVMLTDYSNGADVIMARPGVSSVRQLAGMRVGLEFASLGLYVMTRAAEIEGTPIAAIRIEPADQAEMEEAARSGLMDAAVTYPPASFGLERLGWKPIFDSSRIPGEVADVVVADAAVFRRIPDFQVRLLAAMSDAFRYLGTDPGHAVALMARRERLSDDEFRRALRGIRLVDPGETPLYLAKGGPLARACEQVDRALRKSGQLAASGQFGKWQDLLPSRQEND